MDEQTYANAAAKVEKELWKFKGQQFTRDQMHKECGCDMRQGQHIEFKNHITRVLYEWSHAKKPFLQQMGKREYRIIERTRVPLLWAEVEGSNKVLYYPKDRDTGLELPFAANVLLEDGDVIALAGESNRGKTAMCLNWAAENAGQRDVFLWLSEYHPLQIQRRLAYFPDAYDYLSTHTFKLELENIAAQIADDPDALHILDWVNLSDAFWKIADLDDDIQNALRHGNAIVTLQKMEGETKGIGRDWGEFNTSLYMTLSKLDERYVRLKLEKVKAYNGANPTFKSYRFMVTDSGARIADVDEIKNCRRCHGKGTIYQKGEGYVDCPICETKGYMVLARDTSSDIEIPKPESNIESLF